MITKLLLHKVATYIEPVEIYPTEINYFYGSNGSGKTTLSSIIANWQQYTDCNLTWHTEPTETLVYNRTFVRENFGQSKAIKGIFTLGKNSVDAVERISAKKEKLEIIKKALIGFNNSLLEIEEKEKSETATAADKCWNIKNRHEAYFKPAYARFQGSKHSFLEKCVAEQSNLSDLLSFEIIRDKCNKIFSSSIKIESEIDEFTFSELNEVEKNEILALKIVGREDSSIGKLISKLQNSDWVKSGLVHLDGSKDVCPFCQQDVNDAIKTDIENFFDEDYLQKCNEIYLFKESYIRYIETKLNQIRSIAKKKDGVYNPEALIAQGILLNEVYKNNLMVIEDKIASPSVSCKIESLEPIFREIKTLIDKYSEEVMRNNDTFNNIHTEQTELKNKIWKYISNETEVDIKNYLETIDKYSQAKEKIDSKIKFNEIQQATLQSEIVALESEVTNISHTINEINRVLQLFSFNNFKIAEASQSGFYKIVREDGTDVNQTLSEGESTFITFLYFYQLIKGSTTSSGMNKDKIIVFDDPISSLDSSILFVVSSLIKEVVKECRGKLNDIKQIFILTHNIYFYKEVTFKGGRNRNSYREESFWMIKKQGNKSSISLHTENPIKTTYELLWRELSDLNNVNKATIFNTLRRILEYYFNIIGGLDYEDCVNKFEGEEKLICKSLVSWVNDGSHFINDDLIVHTDTDEIHKYLNVFKIIFEKMDHKSHYDMMMKSHLMQN